MIDIFLLVPSYGLLWVESRRKFGPIHSRIRFYLIFYCNLSYPFTEHYWVLQIQSCDTRKIRRCYWLKLTKCSASCRLRDSISFSCFLTTCRMSSNVEVGTDVKLGLNSSERWTTPLQYSLWGKKTRYFCIANGLAIFFLCYGQFTYCCHSASLCWIDLPRVPFGKICRNLANFLFRCKQLIPVYAVCCNVIGDKTHWWMT